MPGSLRGRCRNDTMPEQCFPKNAFFGRSGREFHHLLGTISSKSLALLWILMLWLCYTLSLSLSLSVALSQLRLAPGTRHSGGRTKQPPALADDGEFRQCHAALPGLACRGRPSSPLSHAALIIGRQHHLTETGGTPNTPPSSSSVGVKMQLDYQALLSSQYHPPPHDCRRTARLCRPAPLTV